MVNESSNRAGLFAGLGGASLGVGFSLWTSGAINPATFGIVMVIPVVLFALALRSVGKLKEAGLTSRATWRYTRDFFASIALYMLGLGVAIALWNEVPGARDFAFPIALLPTIPTIAMIYVMGRYIAEETDEFLRYRTIQSALIGLGIVLTLGSFWGFMETFSVVPNIWAWWVVPVWAIGFGIGQVWLARSDDKLEQI